MMNQNLSVLPPSGRKDARIERTRGLLRRALLVLLEEKPLDRITIRDITARAGTGYATFFRHYSDRSALLNDLAAAEITGVLERTLPILDAADSRAMCLTLCRYVDERRRLWSALLTGGAAGTMREEFNRQARRTVPADAPQHPWLPADLAVVFGVSAVVEILAWWLQHREEFTPDQIADILDRLVIAPLVKA